MCMVLEKRKDIEIMLDKYNYNETDWHRNETLAVAMDKCQELKDLLKECRGLFTRFMVENEDPCYGELVDIVTKIEMVINNE